MKICLVHNEYGKFSGEEAVVESQKQLLREHGHEVISFEKSTADISEIWVGRLRAFFSGIYSFDSRRQIQKLLVEHRPDVVHVHNVFPLISPSILPECKKARIPVVMTVHNYRLVCPNGLFMNKGRVCEKCSGGREYNCLLNNCEGSYFKSLGYFLRNSVARKLRLFKQNVSVFACLTEFQRQKLIDEGFDAKRIVVIANMVNGGNIEPSENIGNYVGFIGRISPEKGVGTLVDAARNLRDITFKAAGAYDRLPMPVGNAPDNCEFLGSVKRENIFDFYKGTRFVVLPSVWYEGFPMVLVEAMMRSKPVVASRIGGLSEIVEDGKTGLLFEPSNINELTEKIRYLWDRPSLCRQMGQAGKEKALREYSPQKYYKHLMSAYEKAIELSPCGQRPD